MDKYCIHCGSMIEDSSKFCSNCGKRLEEETATQSSSNSDYKKIIGLLLIIIAILVIGIVIFSGFNSIPLENQDFGGITMLVPEGSNFVETDSLPSYGTIGGYVMFTNGGEYYYEICNIMFSTIRGGHAPAQVVLDRTEGDIVIYKDGSGENMYYMERQIGDYEVSIIGRNQDTMIEMLNSVNINNPTLGI